MVHRPIPPSKSPKPRRKPGNAQTDTANYLHRQLDLACWERAMRPKA